jgi:hypothetical protein
MTGRPKFIVRHSTYNTRLSTRIANRTHARKRAVSGLVIQITMVNVMNTIY